MPLATLQFKLTQMGQPFIELINNSSGGAYTYCVTAGSSQYGLFLKSGERGTNSASAYVGGEVYFGGSSGKTIKITLEKYQGGSNVSTLSYTLIKGQQKVLITGIEAGVHYVATVEDTTANLFRIINKSDQAYQYNLVSGGWGGTVSPGQTVEYESAPEPYFQYIRPTTPDTPARFVDGRALGGWRFGIPDTLHDGRIDCVVSKVENGVNVIELINVYPFARVKVESSSTVRTSAVQYFGDVSVANNTDTSRVLDLRNARNCTASYYSSGTIVPKYKAVTYTPAGNAGTVYTGKVPKQNDSVTMFRPVQDVYYQITYTD